MYEEYPDGIREQLQYLDSLKVEVIRQLPVFKLAQKCVEQFTELPMYFKITMWGGVKIEIPFVKSEKQITEVLRFLAKVGYKRYREPIDYADDQSRTLYLKNKETNTTIDVVLYLTAENSKCKFVQVGETTTPVYALQCEEEKNDSRT